MSYPALYTHKRNKHNVIPITDKQNVFKPKHEKTGKFKYNNILKQIDIESVSKEIINSYSQLISDIKVDSPFFDLNYSFDEDKFLSHLQTFFINKNNTILIPTPHDKKSSTIDNLLAIYSILLVDVTHDKYFVHLITKFIFLIRKYLNLVGWDYMKYLHEYGLISEYKINDKYTVECDSEQIPDLVNDFILGFIDLDEDFQNIKSELTDLTQNFCHWLYINKFSNLKLFRNDESILLNKV